MKMKSDLLDITATLLQAGIPFEIERQASMVFVMTDEIKMMFSPYKLLRVYQRSATSRGWKILAEYTHGKVRVLRRVNTWWRK